MSRPRKGLFAALTLFCCLAALLPAVASAEVQTLDFESGPPLGSPLEVAGDISFPIVLGFRPYRTDVGSRAHSGTTVGDIGRCLEESEEASTCEIFQANTEGVLNRTATSVTVSAGRFVAKEPDRDPEFAILTAFDADGTPITSSGPVPVDEKGFDATLNVSSPLGNIARFRIVAITQGPTGNAVGGDLGIDDVKVNFASGAKPDFAISTTNQVIPIVQGAHAEVPISLPRVNGSNGPIQLSVSGLPKGVSGAFLPAPVPGTSGKATLRLSASPDAPDTNFVPVEATIKADPLGNSEVGTGTKTTKVSIRVAAIFGLSVNGRSESSLTPDARIPIAVPDCAPVDVPLKISRDISLNQPITLSLKADDPNLTGMPPGVRAEILASPVVSPGGGLDAERTLRFRADAGANIGRIKHPIALVATSGSGSSAISRTLPLELERAQPTAAVSSARGQTPRFGGGGAVRRIQGKGFCPGTTVKVGNDRAEVPTRLVNDQEIEFEVPRYATSGRLTIQPPSPLGQYSTDEVFNVDSFRDVNGFQFTNTEFGGLTLSEFIKGYGVDDVFEQINPCWPFGSCPVQTFFLDPISAIKFGYLNATTIGHCFGMDLLSETYSSGGESLRDFRSSHGQGPATSVFDLPGKDAPSGDLEALLDAYHVRQFSDESYRARFESSDKSLAGQLEQIEKEFARRREPIITMSEGSSGHGVLAYDIVPTADGTDIYTYDPDRQAQPSETLDASGKTRADAIDASIIHIDAAKDRWTFVNTDGETWSGDHTTMSVVPTGAIPDNPQLPGLGTLKEKLKSVIFGSPTGSVRAKSHSAGALFEPAVESLPAAPGSRSTGGTWLSKGGGDLAVEFAGVKQGTYDESYDAAGFAAGVRNVKTAKGVHDAVEGGGDSFSFDSGTDRSLRIQVAQRTDAQLSTAATVDTHASAQGSDTAGFSPAGALTYAHDGAATTIELSLTTLRRNGGPATFASGPIRVRDGDRLSVRALDRDLDRVRVSVRNGGRRTIRVLRNQARSHLHVRFGRPRVSGRRLSTHLKVSGFKGRAVAGAVLRLMRGHRIVAQRAVSVKTKSPKKAKKISWRLPHGLAKGHYRLVTIARAVAIASPGSTASPSVSAQRGFSLSIR